MSERIKVQATAMVAAALVAALTLAGCAGETTCEYFDQAPTGDPRADIAGCWQGIGDRNLVQDNLYLVVYQFNTPDDAGVGEWREVQSPNRLYPSGNQYQTGYVISPPDGGVSQIDLGGEGFPSANVHTTDTSLLMDFFFQTTTGDTVILQQPLRRAQCTGFGFEEPAFTCPGPR